MGRFNTIIAEICNIQIHRLTNSGNTALHGILPHVVQTGVAGFLGLRIWQSRILGYPDFIIFLDSGNFPGLLQFHVTFGSVEHGFISLFFNRLQESQGNIRPLGFVQLILAAVRIIEILTVIYNRIGNGISGNLLCHPGSFFFRLFFRHSCGEEIDAQRNPRLRCFLQIIASIRIGFDFSVCHTPVSNTDNGKVHIRLGHFLPVNGSLIPGYIDSHGNGIRFFCHPAIPLAAAEGSQQPRKNQNQEHIAKNSASFSHKQALFFLYIEYRIPYNFFSVYNRIHGFSPAV